MPVILWWDPQLFLKIPKAPKVSTRLETSILGHMSAIMVPCEQYAGMSKTRYDGSIISKMSFTPYTFFFLATSMFHVTGKASYQDESSLAITSTNCYLYRWIAFLKKKIDNDWLWN